MFEKIIKKMREIEVELQKEKVDWKNIILELSQLADECEQVISNEKIKLNFKSVTNNLDINIFGGAVANLLSNLKTLIINAIHADANIEKNELEELIVVFKNLKQYFCNDKQLQVDYLTSIDLNTIYSYNSKNNKTETSEVKALIVNSNTISNLNPNQPKKNFLSKLVSKFGIYGTVANNRAYLNDNNVDQYNIFYQQIKSLRDMLEIKLNDERISKLESDEWIKLGRETILILRDDPNSIKIFSGDQKKEIGKLAEKIFNLYAKNAVEYLKKLFNTLKDNSKLVDRPQVLSQIDLITKSLFQLAKFVNDQIIDSSYGSGPLSIILEEINIERQNCQQPNRIIPQEKASARKKTINKSENTVQFVHKISGILAIKPQIEVLCNQVNSLLSTENQTDNDILKNALIAAEPFYNQLIAFDNVIKKDGLKTATLYEAIQFAKQKYTDCQQSYKKLCQVQAELASISARNATAPNDKAEPLENLLGSTELKLTFQS